MYGHLQNVSTIPFVYFQCKEDQFLDFGTPYFIFFSKRFKRCYVNKVPDSSYKVLLLYHVYYRHYKSYTNNLDISQ